MNVTTTHQTEAPAGPVAEKSAAPSAPATTADGRNLPPVGLFTPVERPERAVPKVSIEKAVEQIQAFLSNSKRQLSFRWDKVSGRTIIRVIDPAFGEVIRQFPPEELLKVAAFVNSRGFHTFDEQT